MTRVQNRKVGDRVEVRFPLPGGWPWHAATIVEVSPLRVRVEFDAPSPTPHPSWWAGPSNIRDLSTTTGRTPRERREGRG